MATIWQEINSLLNQTDQSDWETLCNLESAIKAAKKKMPESDALLSMRKKWGKRGWYAVKKPNGWAITYNEYGKSPRWYSQCTELEAWQQFEKEFETG